MKTLLKTIILLLVAFQLQAQDKSISGIISDEDGLPLPGVNIIIKGTTTGTQTDFNGLYSIKAQLGDVLRYSYVGYVNEEKTVGVNSIISFSMTVNKEAIDEVIITAYGIKREQKAIGYSIQNVKSNSLIQRLSGKVSGVKVNNASSGSVGSSSRIVMRGNSSITGSNQALIVIDGKIASELELQKIKARKIKGVKILKGSNGAALYGVKGSNGVVLVQTKKGNYKMPDLKALEENANESYTKIHENQFKNTVISPLSTFSIDVDKASYSNVRRLINDGQHIPSDAVKIEEMVNYFEYNYPQPTSKHPFSINTELIKTPWNKETKLVKIGLQGKAYDNKELPASNLTFLIDVSGSMRGELPLLKSAFRLLVNQLREKDKVSIVVYAGAAGVVLKPTSGNDKEKILNALNKLQSGGSTAGGEGIELAYKMAQENFNDKGNNRVILATDGDFNVGASSDEAMEDLIVEKRKSGVFLSVLGFGYGNYKDSKLETLADKGNGNHAYIDTIQEAKLIFGKEFGGTLHTIAKDVKIQVEFNPKKVQAYRLIGYENRLLADEDFIDDSKDAGELGSGHTVTALYEVLPKGVKSDYIKTITDLKYTKSEVKNEYSDELLTVKFRYKKPDEEKSIEMVHVTPDVVHEASEDMKFASAVALFAMQIRQSQFHNNSKIEDVIKLAEAGRGRDKQGYRAEFLRLVATFK